MNAAEKLSEKLRFRDDKEKIEFLSEAFQLNIMHQISQILESRGEKRSDLAKRMDVSDSFVSQLFSGDKHLSLKHLASVIYKMDLDLKITIDQKQDCIIYSFHTLSNFPNEQVKKYNFNNFSKRHLTESQSSEAQTVSI